MTVRGTRRRSHLHGGFGVHIICGARAYVEQACGGKPQLRRRHPRADHGPRGSSPGPLDAPRWPIVAPTIEHSHAEEVGTRIGHYKCCR